MTAPVAISTAHGLDYPVDAPYSPPEAYPEYRFAAAEGGLSRGNQVYPIVRRVLKESGADAARFGTPEWNPLGDWIRPGQRVFILANFVKDRMARESAEDFAAKCTHASVLRAVIDYAAIATGDLKLVSFGNAPIQACDHDAVARQTGASELRSFYARLGHADVGPHDLRTIVSKVRMGAIVERRSVNDDQRVAIDLGADSLLESHYQGRHPVRFRVEDYSGAETMSYHSRGRHVYLVNRRVLDADVLISVPKLKTHSRVGITCALKGTVGAISNKECLAHHRLGSPEGEGDEYPKASWIRALSSMMSDRAGSVGVSLPANAFRIASKVLNRSLRLGPRGVMIGMWHGNDTCWRMSLDIARLLRFADRAGQLAPSPLRHHLALVDGIIGGEGEGPLKPTARRSGTVLFGPDPALVDAACALAMGFEPARIPIVSGAFGLPSLPITEASLSDLRVLVDGEPCDVVDVPARFAPPFTLSKGWRGHVEYPRRVRQAG